jgi:hypothetical protein
MRTALGRPSTHRTFAHPLVILERACQGFSARLGLSNLYSSSVVLDMALGRFHTHHQSKA